MGIGFYCFLENSEENYDILSEEEKELDLVNGFEILWSFGNSLKKYKEDQSEEINEELMKIGQAMNPQAHLIKIKDDFFDPVEKLLEILEKVLPHFLQGEKIVLKDSHYHLLFLKRKISTWLDFQIALALLLENIILKVHLDSLERNYNVQTETQKILSLFEENVK